MKRGMIVGCSVAGGVILIAAIIILWGISAYNNLVNQNQEVYKSWGNVESQYQRRYDLIPNLVNTVKGYANFEKSVLTQVTEARASVGKINISKDILDNPQEFQKFESSWGKLNGALSRLLVTVENYPDLKANENFLQLQAQLEGTENRINVARIRFNEAVQKYNILIQKIPTNIIANFSGFKTRQYFKAAAGAETVPKVEF